MMHSESIHRRLVVGIFFKFHFSHESHVVQSVIRELSPHLQGII